MGRVGFWVASLAVESREVAARAAVRAAAAAAVTASAAAMTAVMEQRVALARAAAG